MQLKDLLLQSEGMISRPQYEKQRLTGKYTVKFCHVPDEPILKQKADQMHYLPERPEDKRLRIHYANTSSSIVRKVFANAGFTISPNQGSADVIWTRPVPGMFQQVSEN